MPGSRSILEKLIQAGADIDAVSSDGITLLMKQVNTSSLPTLLNLLDMGADPTIVSKEGITFIKLVDIWLRRNPEDKAAFEPVFRKLKEKGHDVNALRRQAEKTGWQTS